jgi:crossover junction endodeoxyribonuclease RuvC
MARHRPGLVGTERLFFAKNQTTVMGVAQALGCVLLAVGEAGLPWVETTPPEVKRAVTGQGNAEKRQVQFMVARLLGLAEAPKPDDAADALAVAIAVALATPPRG